MARKLFYYKYCKTHRSTIRVKLFFNSIIFCFRLRVASSLHIPPLGSPHNKEDEVVVNSNRRISQVGDERAFETYRSMALFMNKSFYSLKS